MNFQGFSLMSSNDVIILGAGLSGLCAAREIRKRAPNLTLQVLEAKDRIGGRLLTCSLRTAQGTDQWDLGGQWVGKTQTEIMDLLEELDLVVYSQYSKGKKMMQIGGTQIRSYDTEVLSNNSFLQYSPFEIMDFVKCMYRLETMCAQLDYTNPYSNPKATEWDAQSMESWARENCSTQFMRDMMDIFSKSTLAQSASRVSLLGFLLAGKANGSIENMLETSENSGAQGLKVKGGCQQICRMIADDLPENTVHLQHIVYAVEQNDQNVCVRFRIGEGDKATLSHMYCKRLIIALPPNQSAKIEFVPQLPDSKRQIFDGLPQGNLMKFIVTYPEPFWKIHGFSGEAAASGLTNKPGERRALFLSFDASTVHGNAALVGFFHPEWADTDKDERRDAVLEDLADFFGPEALNYIDYEDKAWCFEPYTGGCAGNFCPPGTTSLLLNITQVDDKIHWAGTETSVRWTGYMSGAVEAGVRAAQECQECLSLSLRPGSQPPSKRSMQLYGVLSMLRNLELRNHLALKCLFGKMQFGL